jgi:HaeII restriction endonuclease
MQNMLSPELTEAKSNLDTIIGRCRSLLYKPIQIAEVLYHHRVLQDVNIEDIKTYQNPSKAWRDSVTKALVGNTCSSSDIFQKSLFDKEMPAQVLKTLADENNSKDGIVEAYIYRQVFKKLSQLDRALKYCENHDTSDFNVKELIDLFEKEPDLKRSIDKVYEIVVYALFSVLAKATELSINLTFRQEKIDLLTEFSEFTKMIVGFELGKNCSSIPIRLYRSGVANASDRGLDIYANFGMVIQIKHISLSEQQAQGIVGAITADRIVIVCKKCDKNVILSLLGQLGWSYRIQSIVTEDHLIKWYEKALRGSFSLDIGNNILISLKEEIVAEFPASGKDISLEFNNNRGYTSLRDDCWIDLTKNEKVKKPRKQKENTKSV